MSYRSYQPIKVCGSKLLQKKWDETNYHEHRKVVKSAKPIIDTAAPPKRRHVNKKLKKRMRERDRGEEIERDNLFLLERMQTIMRTRGTFDHGGSEMRRHHSLNETARHHQMERVMQENKAMLQRLQKVKPMYRIDDWIEDWQHSEELKEMISSYPSTSSTTSTTRCTSAAGTVHVHGKRRPSTGAHGKRRPSTGTHGKRRPSTLTDTRKAPLNGERKEEMEMKSPENGKEEGMKSPVNGKEGMGMKSPVNGKVGMESPVNRKGGMGMGMKSPVNRKEGMGTKSPVNGKEGMKSPVNIKGRMGTKSPVNKGGIMGTKSPGNRKEGMGMKSPLSSRKGGMESVKKVKLEKAASPQKVESNSDKAASQDPTKTL